MVPLAYKPFRFKNDIESLVAAFHQHLSSFVVFCVITMRLFLVLGAMIFITTTASPNLDVNNTPDMSIFQDLSSPDLLASPDLPEISQWIDDDADNNNFFFDDDRSNPMDLFPIAAQDHLQLAGWKPLCSAENEQLSNRPRPRDERDATCDSPSKETVPLKTEWSDLDFNVLSEKMRKLFWPPDAPDTAEDDRCHPTFPFHLCCLELGDPARIVPGELIPGVSIVIYEQAFICAPGA